MKDGSLGRDYECEMLVGVGMKVKGERWLLGLYRVLGMGGINPLYHFREV